MTDAEQQVVLEDIEVIQIDVNESGFPVSAEVLDVDPKDMSKKQYYNYLLTFEGKSKTKKVMESIKELAEEGQTEDPEMVKAYSHFRNVPTAQIYGRFVYRSAVDKLLEELKKKKSGKENPDINPVPEKKDIKEDKKYQVGGETDPENIVVNSKGVVTRLPFSFKLEKAKDFTDIPKSLIQPVLSYCMGVKLNDSTTMLLEGAALAGGLKFDAICKKMNSDGTIKRSKKRITDNDFNDWVLKAEDNLQYIKKHFQMTNEQFDTFCTNLFEWSDITTDAKKFEKNVEKQKLIDEKLEKAAAANERYRFRYAQVKKYFTDLGLKPDWTAIFSTSKIKEMGKKFYDDIYKTASSTTNKYFFWKGIYRSNDFDNIEKLVKLVNENFSKFVVEISPRIKFLKNGYVIQAHFEAPTQILEIDRSSMKDLIEKDPKMFLFFISLIQVVNPLSLTYTVEFKKANKAARFGKDPNRIIPYVQSINTLSRTLVNLARAINDKGINDQNIITALMKDQTDEAFLSASRRAVDLSPDVTKRLKIDKPKVDFNMQSDYCVRTMAAYSVCRTFITSLTIRLFGKVGVGSNKLPSDAYLYEDVEAF